MGIYKLSDRIVELGVRMSDVADAAQGRRSRRRTMTRWLLVPAAGAGLYALGRSDSFARQAREAMDDAKTRAAELPDDLIKRVRQASQSSPSSNGRGRRRRTTPAKRSTSKGASR
jgi:hypothetical protein